MSTIPTTFNEALPTYTVIGGGERLGSSGLSAVLLNRGRRQARRNLFLDLRKTGFDQVVSLEPPPAPYDLEELACQFPFVRFVLLGGELSMGEQVNLAVSELDSPLFFVLWNDLRFVAGGAASRMAERLSFPAGAGRVASRRLCTVPVMQSPRFETLPTLRAPVLSRKREHTCGLAPLREGHRSLYPADGVGVYDRGRFIRMGGFDGALKSRYWQLMDFGFRAHLWGEEISATAALKLSYETQPPPEDTSAGGDYNRFYLKNLAPAFRKDCASLPLRRFPGFLLQGGGGKGFLAACRDFSEGRRWVHTNRFRWRCDPKSIFALWNPNGSSDDLPEPGREAQA